MHSHSTFNYYFTSYYVKQDDFTGLEVKKTICITKKLFILKALVSMTPERHAFALYVTYVDDYAKSEAEKNRND